MLSKINRSKGLSAKPSPQNRRRIGLKGGPRAAPKAEESSDSESSESDSGSGSDDSTSGSSDSDAENDDAKSVSSDGSKLSTPQILFTPATTAPKKKHQAPQDAIDDFWSNFNSKTPGRATTILPKDRYAKKVGEKVPAGIIPARNAAASYEEAAQACRDKVDKIVTECLRVNQKYRDPHFDLEFDLKWGINDTLSTLKNTSEVEVELQPGSVKRVGDIFEKPEFFKDLATAGDIRQGRTGDCWFISALCALCNKPGLIEKVCVKRNEAVGVYGFVFYRDGEWISEVIDDKLFLIKPDYDESWEERILIDDLNRITSEEEYRKFYQTGSSSLYFAQCEDPNETWLPLLEKAFAKAHGDYDAINGGHTGEAIEDLTGGVTTEIFSSDILDKDRFWNEELSKVNKDFLFGCAAGIFRGRGQRKGIIEGHAYSIMKAVEIDGQRLCLVRNPWGTFEWNGAWSDGSKEWTPEWMQKLGHRFGDDGAFWMSYEDLLKKYQTFDRTRLFNEEWKVTQVWTSLTIPWSTEYHTTKFCFTVEKKAPIVLVLSQLNDRYFCGLQGQYDYSLTFRVHKAGEAGYIVRSHGNYWMRRSVTAELELEPGEYHVLCKIEAEKSDSHLPVEDVIRNNAKERRDKLLRIGFSYDLAHAKGVIAETDEEKKLRKEAEKAKIAKRKKEITKQMIKNKRKQKHADNKVERKKRAEAAKQKAKEKAKKARKQARKEEKERLKKEKQEEEQKQGQKEEQKQGQKEEQKVKKKEEETEAKENESIEVTETATAPDAEDNSEVKEEADTSNAIASSSQEPGSPDTAVPDEVPADGKQEDDEESSDEDLSDIDSVISDVDSVDIDNQIAEEQRMAAAAAAEEPTIDDDDEFQKDPWNAITIIGLRVYSRGSEIGVRVVKKNIWSEEHTERSDEKAESKLDVDDSAVDAVKGVDVTKPKKDKDGVSEGSGVIV